MTKHCNRCGACCLPTCPYLVILESGKTFCKVYDKDREKIIIQQNPVIRCGYRHNHHKNYKGCPFNRPEWDFVTIEIPFVIKERITNFFPEQFD